MAIASALELYQGPNAITSGAIPLRSPVVQGREGIDCVMLAGTPFWERTEVKDLLAYLRLAATLSDEVALARIINRPRPRDRREDGGEAAGVGGRRGTEPVHRPLRHAGGERHVECCRSSLLATQHFYCTLSMDDVHSETTRPT